MYYYIEFNFNFADEFVVARTYNDMGEWNSREDMCVGQSYMENSIYWIPQRSYKLKIIYIII